MVVKRSIQRSLSTVPESKTVKGCSVRLDIGVYVCLLVRVWGFRRHTAASTSPYSCTSLSSGVCGRVDFFNSVVM